jgi:hypothetical protein
MSAGLTTRRVWQTSSVDKKLQGAEEEGLPINLGEDLVLLAAESIALARGDDNDADFCHGTISWGVWLLSSGIRDSPARRGKGAVKRRNVETPKR